VEGIWSNLKRSLANLTKQNIDQLTALVRTGFRRMQYRPGLLEGFLAKTGLDLSNPTIEPRWEIVPSPPLPASVQVGDQISLPGSDRCSPWFTVPTGTQRARRTISPHRYPSCLRLVRRSSSAKGWAADSP
jgi:hypothetical protein